MIEGKIADTPVTWALIEEDLCKAFNFKASLSDKSQAIAFAKGCGFLSKSFLLLFDWKNENERMPKKGLLKICFHPPTDCDNVTPDLLNDNEILFYTQSKEVLGIPETIPLAKYFCGRMYNEELGAGYILLEFIEKLSLCHVYHNLQEKPLIEIIGHLAEIAIRGLKLEKKIEKIEQKNAWDVILKDIAELTVTEKRFIDMKVVFPDQSTQIDYILQKFPSIFADFQKFQDLRMTNSPIQLLCHGDLWTTNILFTKDEKGEFQVKALIDWQLFHIGSPVEDLVFLLYSALGPNEIKRTNFYLQVYYDLIKNAVGEEKCPWGEINELIKQYEISYIHMISIIHPMNVNGFEDQIIACDENEIDWCRENFGLKSAAITAELCRCFEKWIQ